MSADLAGVSIPVRILMPGVIYKRLHRAAEAHHTTVGALTVELVRRALKDAPHPTAGIPRELVNGLAEAVISAPEVQKAITKVSTALAREQRRSEREQRRTAESQAREARAQQDEALREERLAAIRALHAEGLSDNKIAVIIGVGQPQVSAWRREVLGLPAHHRSPNQRGTAS